jgi:hypothetical protein
METIRVESYAGYGAEEYPLRFYLDGRQVEIISIEKRWLTPEGKCFKVKGDDGYVYVLQYNSETHSWNLLTINRP